MTPTDPTRTPEPAKQDAPATEAGRELLADNEYHLLGCLLNLSPEHGKSWCDCDLPVRIRRIERESLPTREELAAALHKGFNHGYHGGGWGHGDGDLADAILAALRAARQDREDRSLSGWDGDSRVDGGPRGGYMPCECTYPEGHRDPKRGCHRNASAYDGAFVCVNCRKHTLTPFESETPATFTARTGRRWEDQR